MSDGIGALEAVERSVDALLDGVDPPLLTASAAASGLERVARVVRRLQALEMALVGRVADTKVWQGGGAGSVVDWVAQATGSSKGDAAALVTTGRQLEALPATAAAAKAGDLSPAQAAAVARAASVAPQAERDLVALAGRESLRGLQDECSRRRAAADPDAEARYRRIHRDRGLRSWTDPDGAFRLSLSTTADAGAEIVAGLKPFRELAFREARTSGRRERPEAYDADALVLMARTANHPAPAASTPRLPKRVDTKVIVRIDHTALMAGHTGDGEICEIDGQAVPVSVVREQLAHGDPFVAVVVTDGIEVHQVVHPGRGPNAIQRTALEWMHPHCAALGCDHTGRLQADHRIDYAITGHTTLTELDLLCSADHDRKTYQGWQLEPGVGRRRFLPPDHPGDPRDRPPPGPDPPGDPPALSFAS